MKKNLLAAPENVDTISHIFLSFWHTQRVVQLVYFPTNICCFYLNQLTNHWFRHIDNLKQTQPLLRVCIEKRLHIFSQVLSNHLILNIAYYHFDFGARMTYKLRTFTTLLLWLARNCLHNMRRFFQYGLWF